MRVKTSLLLAAMLSTVAAASAFADSTLGIKMMPPSDFNGYPCAAGPTSGLLFWDGVNPIRCAPNTGVNQNGFLGIGTTNPVSVLDIVDTTPDPATGKVPLALHIRGGVAGYLGSGVPNIQGDIWLGGNTDMAYDGGSDSVFNFLNTGTNFGGGTNFLSFDGTTYKLLLHISNDGTVGIGADPPKATLDVNGEARVGTTGAACTASNAGAIRFNAPLNKFEGCDGTNWTALGFSGLQCITVRSSTSTKIACGFTSQADCPSGYVVMSGGSYSFGNDQLQDSYPVVSNGTPSGWMVKSYDMSGTGLCSGNQWTPDGTVHNGSPPKFKTCANEGDINCWMYGAAQVVCCH